MDPQWVLADEELTGGDGMEVQMPVKNVECRSEL